MITIGIITFLSAFLLFQIELIISKIFLPHFGGSYLVWGACVVFFQGILLAGYLYSHFVVRRFGMFRYRLWHLLLFCIPLVSFPGKELPAVILHQNIPMVFDVFWQLILTIGLVFFALSTTAVISQSWLAASRRPEKRYPYTLYAVSNFGSFAALLSYPFLFEHFLDLDSQLLIWRLCYALLLLLHVFLLRALPVEKKAPLPEGGGAPVAAGSKIRWLLYSAASVIAFLSVTNVVTYEITPVPLFWVIPLGIYLFSFVLNFKARPYCPRWITGKFHYATAAGILLFFLTELRILPIFIQIVAYYVLLYVICMFCQAKLILHKPADKRNLTVFYVFIATGGFFGGMITTWVAPVLSSMMIEFLLALFVIHLALFLDDREDPLGFAMIRYVLYPVFILILWPLTLQKYNVFLMILLFQLFRMVYRQLGRRPKAVFMSVAFIFLTAPFLEAGWQRTPALFTKRNYYGLYRVNQKRGLRALMNGTTLHGTQYLDPRRRMEPTSYYHSGTGLGQVMGNDRFSFKRIGVVGLGIGGVCAWGREGQVIDFFELDPDVHEIARDFFTFLEETPAEVNCIIGDARLKLAEVASGTYDLLVVDAFSGDSIPVHLLTTEAIAEYLRVLKPSGMILLHLSNRYLNLIPVVLSNARPLNLPGAYKTNKRERMNLASHWAAITADTPAHTFLVSELEWKTLEDGAYLKPWTDRRTSILPVLRIKVLLNSLRYFRPFRW
ncbi:MAG: fused MFS/spermidine synthase [Candidatus Omnitrophica bacterium]|nr:fused MFS/spermidine synthase [Candidatus Omnitrophota bacterium]